MELEVVMAAELDVLGSTELDVPASDDEVVLIVDVIPAAEDVVSCELVLVGLLEETADDKELLEEVDGKGLLDEVTPDEVDSCALEEEVLAPAVDEVSCMLELGD